MNRPLRAVIYARVSKPGEKSVADQETVGRRDLAGIGAEVVAVFSDKQSASRYRKVEDRPGFIACKDFIRGEGTDLLWTFANNRAHRDLDDYTQLRRLCITTGTLWRYGNRTYDLSKPADRRAANADALRAEEQGDDISEATRRGTAEALEDGRAHGKLPRGYRIIRDDLTGDPIRREPIPEQAAVIRQAAARVLEFESLSSVARDLEPAWREAGGKGLWNHGRLRALLINPTYAGLRTSQGVVVREGKWEPILSVEEHEQLVALLTNPARLTHRGSAPAYWLSYIAVCGKSGCGDPVVPKGPIADRPLAGATYRCRLGHVSRPMRVVDAFVEDMLLSWLEDPLVAAKVRAPEVVSGPSLEDELAEIDRLERGLLEWVQDAARAGLSATVVGAYQATVQEQIEEVRARMDSRMRDPLLAAMVGPGARDRWGRADLVQRRNVVRSCMKVVINPTGRRRNVIGVEVFPVGVLA